MSNDAPRLLSEAELDDLLPKKLMRIKQCHAVVDLDNGGRAICKNDRRSYKRTCDSHRFVRGSDILGALVASRGVTR